LDLGGSVHDSMIEITDYVVTLEYKDFYKQYVQVLPHYIEDCHNLKRKCRIEVFTLPEVRCLTLSVQEQLEYLAGLNDPSKKALSDNESGLHSEFLKQLVFYFHPEVEFKDLEEQHRIKQQLESHGGKCVEEYSSQVTCVVLHYRNGPVYIQAVEDDKMVGNLYWIEVCILIFFKLGIIEFNLIKIRISLN
jgi:hypothetical protein